MRFFGKTNIDFIGKRKIAFTVSGIIIALGIIAMIISGLKYSIDFTGGVSLELDMSAANENGRELPIQEIRDVLVAEGITDAEIQEMHDMKGRRLILIKSKVIDDEKSEDGLTKGDHIVHILQNRFPNNYAEETFVRQQEEVGPRIGEELKGKAFLAIFWALLGIILYIWWRFEFTFGIAAIAALVHDVLITIGIFAILGKEISLPVVAALLTIVGYSLNDTIVVFDRIREDIRKYRKQGYADIINSSINETLSRTIITSLTTFLVVLCLYIFGGSVINDFAFAMLVGVVVGTYSSIYIASPVLVGHFTRKSRIAKRK